jgi:hypothetical protein
MTIPWQWIPGRNCQAISTKSGLLSERKRQYDKSLKIVWKLELCANLGNNGNKTKGIFFECKTTAWIIMGLWIWESPGNNYRVRAQNTWFSSTNHKNWAEASYTKSFLNSLTSSHWVAAGRFQWVGGHNTCVNNTSCTVQAIESRHCSLNFESPAVQSLKEKKAARPGVPGRTYFREMIVTNGEQ